MQMATQKSVHAQQQQNKQRIAIIIPMRTSGPAFRNLSHSSVLCSLSVFALVGATLGAIDGATVGGVGAVLGACVGACVGGVGALVGALVGGVGAVVGVDVGT
jgi:hypothetical protein